MRGAIVLATCLSVLSGASVRAADEPFWNERPLGYWLNQLRDGDVAARAEAARGVGEIAVARGGPTVKAAVPLLVNCLDTTDVPLREAAAVALGPIGPTADPASNRLLGIFEHDPDSTVRRAAGVSIARIRPGAGDVINVAARVVVHDTDAGVRQAAAAALVEAGAAAGPVFTAVQRGMADRDPMVRIYSAAVAARIGDAPRAIEVMLAGLKDPDAAVRAESAGLLADVAPSDQASVPALVGALGDQNQQVRVAAVDALGVIGRPARPALQPLWHLIRDPDEEVRDHALKAIRLIKE